VSQDPTESNLQTLAAADRSNLLEPAGVQFSGEVAKLPRGDETAPRREPLWGLLLAALVALLASELLLASRLARQRAGFTVSGTMM
jgi:hypothetical protein